MFQFHENNPMNSNSRNIHYYFFREIIFYFFRHAQALAALKAWCHWLSQLHSLALKDSTYEPQCKGIVNHVLNK